MLALVTEMAEALEIANTVIEGEYPADQWQDYGVYRNLAALAKFKEMTK
jgi:hypothetical protein